MNWWILCFPYHILCSLVFQLSAAEPNQCLDLPRILDVTLVSSDGQKARVPPVTHQSLRLQLLQLLHLGLKLPQHPKWVASSFAESTSLYYVIVQLRERERETSWKIEYDRVLSSAFSQMLSGAVSAFAFNRVTVAAGGLRANASFTSWSGRRLSRAEYVNS